MNITTGTKVRLTTPQANAMGSATVIEQTGQPGYVRIRYNVHGTTAIVPTALLKVA